MRLRNRYATSTILGQLTLSSIVIVLTAMLLAYLYVRYLSPTHDIPHCHVVDQWVDADHHTYQHLACRNGVIITRYIPHTP